MQAAGRSTATGRATTKIVLSKEVATPSSLLPGLFFEFFLYHGSQLTCISFRSDYNHDIHDFWSSFDSCSAFTYAGCFSYVIVTDTSVLSSNTATANTDYSTASRRTDDTVSNFKYDFQ